MANPPLLSGLRLGRKLLVLLAGLSLTAFAHAEETARPLEIGLFPNLSARTVIGMYQPLHDFLEKRLGRPVNLYTAPSFKTFVERSLQKKYDIMVAAPHFSRLAQTDAGYQPIVTYSLERKSLLVVSKNSAIKDMKELRGKCVAVPDPLAIMSIVSIAMLKENGLESGKDFTVVDAHSHDNAVLMVEQGTCAAAATSAAPLAQMPPDVRDGVKILAASGNVPHQMVMAHPRYSAAEVARFRNLLLEFQATPEGRRFMESYKFGGVRPVSDAEMKQLDPYVAETKKMLGLR